MVRSELGVLENMVSVWKNWWTGLCLYIQSQNCHWSCVVAAQHELAK